MEQTNDVKRHLSEDPIGEIDLLDEIHKLRVDINQGKVENADEWDTFIKCTITYMPRLSHIYKTVAYEMLKGRTNDLPLKLGQEIKDFFSIEGNTFAKYIITKKMTDAPSCKYFIND